MESQIVVIEAPNTLRVCLERLDHDNITSSQIAAKTLHTAISPGTELAAYSGAPSLIAGSAYPRIVGYLNVAQVIAIGSAVSSCEIGDFIISNQSHRSCFICEESEVLVVIKEETDLRSAAVTYLFHLGYDALLRARFAPGKSIAVVGLGAIGLAAVGIASSSGALVTAFSDRSDSMIIAHTFGAIETCNKQSCLAANDRAAVNYERQFDIVITTSNYWPDWLLALNLAKPHGIICVLGFPGRYQPAPGFNPLDTNFTYAKQLNLIWCGNPTPQYYQEVNLSLKSNMVHLFNLITNGKLPAAGLISDVRPWTDIEDIYRRLLAQATCRLTYILDWN